MVRSKVRGLVCWMYLLPNWLTPRGQPVCERLGGTTDMLARTGGERKAGRGRPALSLDRFTKTCPKTMQEMRYRTQREALPPPPELHSRDQGAWAGLGSTLQSKPLTLVFVFLLMVFKKLTPGVGRVRPVRMVRPASQRQAGPSLALDHLCVRRAAHSCAMLLSTYLTV